MKDRILGIGGFLPKIIIRQTWGPTETLGTVLTSN